MPGIALRDDIAYLQRVCRSHIVEPDKLIKVAELGGDGQDAPFEQSFSNLAHAYIRSKAPSLLDHELGFQLVDRNQENTKAVGVFAFKVGSQNLFAPVFFLKGELKGHELLYLKDQDMFVPLKENWLNYILNRKPNILGTGVTRQMSQMGVRQPDLNRLSRSPYKYASSIAPFMPVFAHLALKDWHASLDEFTTHCQERLDLGQFMKQASLPALEAAVNLMKQRPKIATAFDQWHGMSTLQDAVKEAKARLHTRSIIDNPYAPVNRNQPLPVTGSIIDILEKKAADGDKGPKFKQKIKIITLDTATVTGLPEGIDEEDQEKLLKDTILIKDTRDDEEVSVALNVQVEERLTNPTETGIYQLLTKPGEFEKCLVITNPQGPDGRKDMVTVIRLDDSTRNWGNFPRGDVWVSGMDEQPIPGGEDAWQNWFKSLDGVESLSEDNKGRYVLIGPRRNATCPFRVIKAIGESNGTKSFTVDFSDQFDRPDMTKGLHRYNSASYIRTDEYDRYYDGQRIHLDAKDGTDLRSNQGDVYIPKNYKIIKLQPSKKDKAEDDDKECGPCAVSPRWGDESETPPIQPGRMLDATMQIMKKTAALKIASNGSGYHVNNSPSLSLNAALTHLVWNHGFREDISRHMLKEADSRRQRMLTPFTCRVKYASPFLTDGGPSAPSIDDYPGGGYNPMGWPGTTQSMYQHEIPVPDMSASRTDPNIYNVNPANTPEPMDANNVARAAQSGQREVFDTTMIGSMLRAVRDDTMIDRYLPDMIKGVDRLGRILFMFYWHQDKFAERYGKQDMPELEDSLRNAFEQLGDVVLFLKQKTIEPYPEEDVKDIDLGGSNS